jgi:hypothetical protein
MSGEAEAVGAAVTAGLAASVVDGPDARKPVHGQCINCGAPLAGNYCATCGQPAHVHRKLAHMAGEFLHNLFHLDTRAWRTLPLLLFRPGRLTHDYIHGKRARYISPLAMFLLTVFTMILVFDAVGGSRIGVGGQENTVAEISSQIEEVESALAEARAEVAELETSGADPEDVTEARGKFGEMENELRGLRVALAAANLGSRTGAETPAGANAEAPGAEGDGSIYAQVRASTQRGEIKVDTGWPVLDQKIRQNLLNPELAIYKIQNTADNFAFLLVPISLPFVWLMFFWKRGVTLFDHTVYILYSLSFVSILFVFIALIGMIPGVPPLAMELLLLGALVHSFFHLKGGYGLGWFSALWRLPVQLLFSTIALAVFVLAILILGLVG